MQHELAIRRLIALYAQLLDDRRFKDIGELFCEEGILPWGPHTFRGPAEITQGLLKVEPPQANSIKHFALSPVIDVSGDEASAWTDVIVSLVPPQGPAEMSSVGRYYDRFRRENGAWLFASHIAVQTGAPLPAEVQPPPPR